MNHQFWQKDLLTILTGTAATIALVTYDAPATMAKSATEIAQIAIATTVKIDNNLGSPGGSGVIIAKQGNTYTILTANHVISNPNVSYTIQTSSKRQYTAISVINLKEKTSLDLGVIKFESPEPLKLATVGNPEFAVVGSNIYVSGYPLTAEIGAERNHEFTSGTVTSIRDEALEGYSLRYQALTRRGMSGGAVFNTNGQLIGIHGQAEVVGSVKSESSSIPEPLKTGFNAAIPVNKFMNVAESAGVKKANLIVKADKPEEEKQDTLNVQATQDYVRGIELLEKGDATRANQYLQEASEKNPNNVMARYYQGLIDYTKKDLESAIQNYNQSIQLNPNFSLAYFSRALAYYRLGNKQKAFDDYSQALKLNPSDPWSYLNRGIVREDFDDRLGAISDYDRAITVAPEYGKAFYNRGILRYYQRDFDGALADFDKASQLFFQTGDNSNYQASIEAINTVKRSNRNSPSGNTFSTPANQPNLGGVNPTPTTPYNSPSPTPTTPYNYNSPNQNLEGLREL
jgi:serine protease Do